ncbi:MAG: hypothetical protein MR383_11760 [Lachnospiraceae bacterium]|nr:hypothetical protein [Lachnospiraceae bacterium]MDD7026375.1 transglutaminase domain-containing protein [Lachnospiraceae bacterium]
MKIVKGILIAFAALFILFGGLVIASAFNPGISEAIGDFLYSGRSVPKETETPQATEQPQAAAPVTVPETEVTEAASEPESSYTGSGNAASTKVTVDWNNRYVDKMEALAKEEAQKAAASVSTKYTAPEEKNIKIPDAVSGKTGYAEIKDQGETLDDEAAKKVTTTTDYGNLGLNFEFDAKYYPYFHMLGQREKYVYRQIYANANDMKTTFTPVEEVNASQLLNIFTAVCYDHPELFWIETAYGSKYNRNGICIQIELKYNDMAKKQVEYWKKFENEADTIVLAANGLASDYEKEKYVHDILLEKTVYNKSAAYNQSAYSALVNGQSVCAGYARAFQHIMIKLGIPCYFVGGTAGESHAWNIVQLGNEYYNVDLTWDDTGDDGKYDYFNKTDEDYKRTHIRKGLSVNLPPCNGTTYRIAEDEEGNLQLSPHLRALADTDFGEGDLITSIWDYYDDCYWKIAENGVGYYTFQNVIEGDQLFNEWQYNNQNNLHWSSYIDGILNELGASYCHISMEVERLQDNRYLITHTVSVGK